MKIMVEKFLTFYESNILVPIIVPLSWYLKLVFLEKTVSKVTLRSRWLSIFVFLGALSSDMEHKMAYVCKL